MAQEIFTKDQSGFKTYVFEVKVEQDEDGRWAASCPALPGCATWGYTQDEALKNIREAVEAYVEDMQAHNEAISGAKEVIAAPLVSVVSA
ncbi:type II toxin-antitoxin system HicB family antitoxin [Candidatus Uhrbacteria bacterium]|nr:type II toxin-antitoxin system HicB family antitoxin [Candidatus Uhrbacteria bacterium]